MAADLCPGNQRHRRRQCYCDLVSAIKSEDGSPIRQRKKETELNHEEEVSPELAEVHVQPCVKPALLCTMQESTHFIRAEDDPRWLFRRLQSRVLTTVYKESSLR